MRRFARPTNAEVLESARRLKLVIRGAVQGVGFRPFIYRLAVELGLAGWVKNSSQGVFIEVEGDRRTLEEFLLRIEAEKPHISSIQSLESVVLDPRGYVDFEIQESDEAGDKTALVLPDIATCEACLKEIFDPADRRYLYPFTNCTHCGPRFSIIENLPYDRPSTTMRHFSMCERCRAEYESPLDRRFHAQPDACPDCGPHLELWDDHGKCLSAFHEAMLGAAEAICQGKIVAVKGIGGFHLVADARNEDAVLRLRHRKAREEKPLALMYPSLTAVKSHCVVAPLEERLLLSPECPIVLLRREAGINVNIASSVAPNNPCFGVVLPYSPLHHILMRLLGFPVVATSGNRSDEPICTDEYEALQRLSGIADLFLVHNRPIARHVDDSIVRVIMDREQVLRRARGYAPLPIQLKKKAAPALAVGGHLKNTVAISVGSNAFLSQHIGDLETTQAHEAFQQVIISFKQLYEFEPNCIACDGHPDYLSSRYARNEELPLIEVQHHYAHILSCMADNEIDSPVLGVSWDGTGYGTDGTIWGGEFLKVSDKSYERVAHFRTFPLPGGGKAIEEPRRAALGLLYAIFGDDLFGRSDVELLGAFSAVELKNLQRMLSKRLNCPLTSSAGRLFDAVASILGIRQISRFEGQAAMEIEFLTEGVKSDDAYPFVFYEKEDVPTINWEPTFRQILLNIDGGLPLNEMAARFHNTLVECIVTVARHTGEERVVLSGGCFQNRYLTEGAIRRLQEEGFHPYRHQRVPPNDGGIALGQIVAASLDHSAESAPGEPHRSNSEVH